MSKFSKGKKRKNPAISTASLPDIVFMLLFFFMVTTKPRKADNFVELSEPTLSETVVLDKDKSKLYFHVGMPKGEKNSVHRVFVDGQLVQNYKEISQYLKVFRTTIDEAQYQDLINVFKVDEGAPMGDIKKIQDELRAQDALTVQYSSKKK